MAPKSSQKPAPKPGGMDIRGFFGGGGGSSSQSQAGPSQSSKSQSQVIPRVSQGSNSKKSALIEIVDTDDEDMTKNRKPTKPSSASKPKTPKEPASTKPTSKPTPTSKSTPKSTPKPKPKTDRVMVMDSDSDSKPLPAPTLKRKKPSALLSSDDESSSDEEDQKPPRKKKTSPVAMKKGGTEDKTKSMDVKKRETKKEGGGDSKPKANGKAKEEPPTEPKNPKPFNWAASKAAKLAGPSAPGSKPVPEPKDPMCLSGLAFVFTGELDSFSREEAIDLAKRFGGRVTGQPSSKTSYVVLGSNAGPSKLAVIKKHGLTTLSEDEFLEMIATRVVGGKGGVGYDEKTRKRMAKEEEGIRKGAQELERREKEEGTGSSKILDVSTQLWTTRYAPQSLREICGNKGQVEKLQNWLNSWTASRKSNFKKPGKEGMNVFRAVMITGPPGIGKTTSAHLCAKLAGFTPIEVNASDSRSKKLVENGINMDNTSLDGWMGNGKTTNAAGVPITDQTCLIMDEVDGMSAGDRGGVGALNALIKKTKIPIICIANDRGAQKLKPLMASTYSLTFRKPDVAAVRSRIMTIAFKEKMKIPANVIDQLVNGAQSDIRQVLNMLSTWKLSSDSMDFDEGKGLAKMNEKFSIMTPFDVINKMLGPYMFSNTSRETLGDKMELYFHDHSFVPLFIQENYLKTQPARVRNLDGPPQILKQLELMDQAASSISDGDLVDALIHGPEQHWGLMPLHAVCSTVRPASFLYGQSGGYGGPNAMTFPQFLGQNSKQGKLSRQLGDVQIRMRLKVSGDKSEIRQSYLPALFPHIVKPLIDVGASAVEDVIERMDEYYLSREDWDTVVELGIDQNKDDLVLKKISAATKTTLTKKYNASDHPIPFHKAQDLGKAPKKLGGGPAPDIEDAYDLADEAPEPASDDDKKKKSSDDISNDKLIKAKKAKGKGKK